MVEAGAQAVARGYGGGGRASSGAKGGTGTMTGTRTGGLAAVRSESGTGPGPVANWHDRAIGMTSKVGGATASTNLQADRTQARSAVRGVTVIKRPSAAQSAAARPRQRWTSPFGGPGQKAAAGWGRAVGLDIYIPLLGGEGNPVLPARLLQGAGGRSVWILLSRFQAAKGTQMLPARQLQGGGGRSG